MTVINNHPKFTPENIDEIFSILIETANDYAIFALDVNGNIVTWNKGAQRLKQYEAPEILGQHFSKFYSKEDQENGKPQMELQVASSIGRFEDEGWRYKKDGSKFWANVIIAPLYNSEGVLIGFSKITRDLSERKNAELKLKELNESLESKVVERTMELQALADRLESALKSRNEFITVASHELNTPLTSLKLQAQMRLKQLSSKGMEAFTTDRMNKILNDDIKQINRLSKLVEDMLDMTKLSVGALSLKTEKVNLSELLKLVINKYQNQINLAGNQLIISTDDIFEAKVDPFRFEQVIANLLINAIKYAPKSTINMELKKNGANGLFIVQDSGPGISKEDHERIFLQFERATPSSEVSGLGLGLFIVKEILKAHNGSIILESKKGQGSRFTVEFPL
jgi:PAS domain S-box-containing protein